MAASGSGSHSEPVIEPSDATYANTMTQRVEEVIQLWSQLTDIPVTERARANLNAQSDLSILTGADNQTLTEAAGPLLDTPRAGLAFVDWVDATRALQIRDHLLAGDPITEAPSPIGRTSPRQRLLDQVLKLVAESQRSDWASIVDSSTLREALMRIVARASQSEMREGSLVQRRAKWRREPTSAAGTPPVIIADEVEQLIVHVLSLTHPVAQFSATPSYSNRVFAGWKPGYHRDEQERRYVTGLSDILDSVSDVVQGHRDGVGGRFYIQNGAVECPDCRSVIAWIGEARDARVAPAIHSRPSDGNRGPKMRWRN